LIVGAISPVQAGLDDGLVSYFKLDETSGTTALDSSGNLHNGTLIGTNLKWAEGRDAGALSISPPVTGDVADRLEFPTTGMSVTAGSVSVWAYLADPQPGSSGRYVFGHTAQPQFNSRIQLYMQDGTNVSRKLDFGLGGSHTTKADMVELPMNEWLHLAFTWNNGTYFIYHNGAQLATGSYSGLTTLNTIANFGNDGSSTPYEAFGGMLDEARVYNRAITADEVKQIFEIPPASMIRAQSPSPANKATDVARDVVLAWTPSEVGETRDVYFGTSVEDVTAAERTNPKGVLVGQGQQAAEYDPAGLLEFGKTYYWRIDEVDAASTVYRGEVWSFTTESYSYPIQNVTATASSVNTGMGPEKTVDGSGLSAADQHSTEPTDMWLSANGGAQPTWIQYQFDKVYKLDQVLVWNSNQMLESVLGFGVKEATIEYSVDGATWTSLGNVEVAQASGDETCSPDAVELGGIAAKFVKLTMVSNWAGMLPQYGLSEVRFLYVPVQPASPAPADAATGAATDGALSWRAGREAVSHKVYFGTDKQSVIDGTAPAKTVTDAAFDAGDLTLGTTYYWKVVEANEAATPSVWESDVWSFTTSEFVVVDDIEAYTDDEGSRIYESWIDGLTSNTNGSLVGYMEAPFAERTILHGGKQSMPIEYNNVNTPFYSEAEREFESAQNWTVSGADTLSLWVRGNPAAYVDNAGQVTMTAAGHDIWDAADDFRFAYKTLSGNGSIVMKVESLVNTNVWAKAGLMIRQSLDADSKFVYQVVSFSSGVSMGTRSLVATTPTSVTTGGVAAPQWVKLTRTGDVFTAQYSADGKTWLDMKNADGTVATSTLALSNPVYIGLCVTSHNSAATTTAVMSGVAVTGAVSGDWQAVTIGDELQPANSPTDLYVTVQDSAGKTATAVNAAAAISAEWTQWKIPFSSLTGVNLKAVKKLYIGAGNKTSPVKGGWGMLYIDDIGFGRPAGGQ
jgi:regulation of enolase protein 1 (concanavalin A-like superfamily)